MKTAKTAWNWIVNWFEYGDLVPLIVIISAVHYASMLQEHDIWYVAVAIGLLVDLGHFRTVRAAVRYGGNDWKQNLTRWGMAFAMTSVAIAYQQRYYGDWWLSLPLPFLIASLAWLQRVDAHIAVKPSETEAKETAKERKLKAKVSELEAKVSQLKAKASETPAEQEPLEKPQSEPKPAESEYPCEFCDYVGGSQNGLNAHQRYHTEKKNGKVKDGLRL